VQVERVRGAAAPSIVRAVALVKRTTRLRPFAAGCVTAAARATEVAQQPEICMRLLPNDVMQPRLVRRRDLQSSSLVFDVQETRTRIDAPGRT